MPVLTLRRRRDGRLATFINVHNPADTRRYPRQRHWRSMALQREVALVRRLRHESPAAVFVTGDMNDHTAAYCAFTATAGLFAAHAGPPASRWRPPQHAGIDWILGLRGTQFSSYSSRRDDVVRRTTDHPVVTVRLVD